MVLDPTEMIPGTLYHQLDPPGASINQRNTSYPCDCSDVLTHSFVATVRSALSALSTPPSPKVGDVPGGS